MTGERGVAIAICHGVGAGECDGPGEASLPLATL